MIEAIKGKSKQELQKLADQKVLNIRIWLQEHGELALGVGFLVGIVAMVATKLLVAILVLACVGALVIWQLAPEESSQRPAESGTRAESQTSDDARNGHPEVDSSSTPENHSSH